MAKQKITREELVEIRKREMARKEMEQNIRHWTKMEEEEQRYTEMKFRDKNPVIVFLIRFGYVFIILQAIVWAIGIFLPFVKILAPYTQIFIWMISLLAGILNEKNFNHLLSLFR
jgi:uncharacterized membrane protein